ncbi:uncharacterized protein [Clytia hemisphaerica]|uniref:uncharacterized protein n=1 Tax=Clytia hemisphaerica TaxID=252671 RepID=UPI0034D6508D
MNKDKKKDRLKSWRNRRKCVQAISNLNNDDDDDTSVIPPRDEVVDDEDADMSSDDDEDVNMSSDGSQLIVSDSTSIRTEVDDNEEPLDQPAFLAGVSEQSGGSSSPSLLESSSCSLESDLECLEDGFDSILCERLKQWSLKNHCTRACVNEILGIVGDLGCNVPKDKRTLLKTQRTVTQTAMGLGNYIYIGVENRVTKLLAYDCNMDCITLFVNMDGLPLFKSSTINLWPILVQFHNFKPISVAFFCGKSKPPFNEFMHDFVVEMKNLINNGITFNNLHYPVSLFCITSDAPARSGMKGIIQHTGFFSCERCGIRGVSHKNRIVFDRDQEGADEERTDELFRENVYAIPDEDGKRHQMASLSLPTYQSI